MKNFREVLQHPELQQGIDDREIEVVVDLINHESNEYGYYFARWNDYESIRAIFWSVETPISLLTQNKRDVYEDPHLSEFTRLLLVYLTHKSTCTDARYPEHAMEQAFWSVTNVREYIFSTTSIILIDILPYSQSSQYQLHF